MQPITTHHYPARNPSPLKYLYILSIIILVYSMYSIFAIIYQELLYIYGVGESM